MTYLGPQESALPRIEIRPGVHVRVRGDQLPEAYGRRPCWTFITDGLATFGQREIVFSTVAHASDPEPPAEPITFLRTVAGEAARGNIVGSGGRTRFGEQGLFGDWTGIGYVSMSPLLGLRAPEDALLAVFLLPSEVDVVEEISLSRVLTRLGQAYRFFPFPWWSDPSRLAVVDRTWITGSILNRVRRATVLGCTSVFANNRLVIQCSRDASARLQKVFASVGVEEPVALLTEREPRADAHLVWEPGQTGPAAINVEGTKVTTLTGSFLLLMPGRTEDGAQMFEDGFVLWLSKRTAGALRDALLTGKNIAVPGRGTRSGFELRWV